MHPFLGEQGIGCKAGPNAISYYSCDGDISLFVLLMVEIKTDRADICPWKK